MATRPIDEKIVAMKMDNSDLKRKAIETTSIFGKIQTAMGKIPGVDMSKVTQSFGNIQSAAQKVDLTSLANNVETIAGRFSNLGIVATTALVNISNKAINAGATLLKSMTTDPIMDGFREYELKMGSIGTMLANTEWAGSTLDDVKRTLNDLNNYADKTIYNFGQMTQNIGRFTAAGVTLEDSAIAIKGLGNLAAVSGSDVNQLNTAMYQMSQALAAGKLNLMDWNSLVNAGMAGKKTQDALVATAKAMGKNVDLSDGFRNSIEQGWLTSEVFLETLKKFGKDESMTEAATRVKTFTGMIDALKEGVGSGWATTWELVFGDFEEATKRWTALSNVIGGFFQRSADSRNKLVKSLADMGAFQLVFDVVTNIGKSILMVMDAITKGIGKAFSGMNSGVSGGLSNMIKGFSKLSAALVPNESTLKVITILFQGLFSVVRFVVEAVLFLGKVFLKVLSIPFVLIKGIIKGLVTVVGFFGDLFTKFVEGIRTGKLLTSTVSGLKKAYSSISDTIELVVKNLETFGNAVYEAWNILTKGDFTGVGPWAEDSKIVDKLFRIRESILIFISGVQEAWNILAHGNFTGVGPWEEDSEIIDKLFRIREAVFNFCSGVVEAWNILVKGENTGRGPWDRDAEIVDKLFTIREAVLEFVSGVVEAWNILANGNYTGKGPWEEDSEIVDKLFRIREAVMEFASVVVEAWNILVNGNYTGIGPWEAESVIVAKLFSIRNSAIEMASGVVESWNILTKGTASDDGPWSKDSEIVKSLFRIRDTFKEIGNSIASVDYSFMLAPIGLIVKGFEVLGTHLGRLDFSGVLTSIANGFEMIVGYIKDMNISLQPVSDAFGGFFDMIVSGYEWVKDKLSGIGQAIIDAMPSGNKLLAGGFIASLVAIVGVTLKMAWDLYEVFTGWGKIGQGVSDVLEGVGGALEGFGRAMTANAIATTVISVAIAIGLLAISLKLLATIEPEKIGTSLTALVTSLTGLIGAMAIMSKYDITGQGLKTAVTLIGLAVAFAILSGALKKIADLSWADITKGIIGLVGIMGSLSIAIAIMGNFGGAKVGASALQMVAIAGSIHILLSAIKKIAEISVGALTKGVATIGIILLELSIFMRLVSGTKFGIGSTLGMLAVGQAIENMATAIQKIAKIDTKSLIVGLTTITLILAQITLFARLTSDMGLLSAGAGMLILSAALTALIVPISILGHMDLATLAKGIGAMAVVLLAIGAASKLMMGMALAGFGLLLVAGALTALLVPIGAFAAMGWGPMLTGLAGLALTLGVIGGVTLLLAPAIPLLTAFGLGILALGAGMALAGVAFPLFATGLMTLATLTAGAVTTIVAVIGTLLVGLASLIPTAIDFIVQIIVQIATAIAENAPIIGAKIAELVIGLVAVLTTYLPKFIEKGTEFILKLLEGLSNAIPALINGAIEFMVTLIERMAEALRNNGERLITAMMELMGEIIILVIEAGTQVIRALFGWIPGVNDAMEEVGTKAEQAVRDSFGAREAGQDKGKDFANALGAKSGDARTAGSKVGKSGQDGANSSNLKTVGSTKGQDFATALAQKASQAKTSGTGLAEAGKTGAGSIDMSTTGSNFGEGFAGGISSAYDSVVSAAKSLAQAAKAKVESWLDMHSPSREMFKDGGWFGEGFALGIRDKVKRVADSAKGLAVTAKETLNNFLDGFEIPEEDNELHFKAVIDYESLNVSKFGNVSPLRFAPDTSTTNRLVSATKYNQDMAKAAQVNNVSSTNDAKTQEPIVKQPAVIQVVTPDKREVARWIVDDVTEFQDFKIATSDKF